MRRNSITCIVLSLLVVGVSAIVHAETVSAVNRTVCAVYFTNSNCVPCAAASRVVTDLLANYTNFVVIEYDTAVRQNLLLFANYSMTYRCGDSPCIIFGMGDFLSKENITADNLKDKIVGYSSTGNGLPLQEGSKVDHENLDFNKLPGLPQLWGSSQNPPSNLPTVFVIIGAAVLDSINPCEFAVLVILLSGVIAGEGREKALKTGIAFVSGVFMMYFLMGLGIFAIVKNFNITYYFYKAVGVFALIVGAINIRDYFSKDSGGVLSSVPQSWRPRVQKLLDSVTSVPGALFSGFFVSIFLLPCTSAPYEVILGWIAKETAIDISAVMLLLLYNLIFILPMVAIVLAVYFGLTTPAKAAHWKHRRVRLLHLIAGVVMVGMGIWMVFFFG